MKKEKGEHTHSAHATRRSTLAGLCALKKHFEQDAKIVAGNTEIGIEMKLQGKRWPVLVSTAAVPGIASVVAGREGRCPFLGVSGGDGSGNAGEDEAKTTAGVWIGGAATLSEVRRTFAALYSAGGDAASCTRALAAMDDMLSWFASRQIRNVAALAGNVATASPISDMNPALMAMGATLVLASSAAASDTGARDVSTRPVPIRDFFVGYRRTLLRPDEVIAAIFVPLATATLAEGAEEAKSGAAASATVAAAAGDQGQQAKPAPLLVPTTAAGPTRLEFVRCYKQARRRDDDISIVTATFRAVLSAAPGDGAWRVEALSTGFGGMAAVTCAAKQLEAAATGGEFSEAAFLRPGLAALSKDFCLPDNVPGGELLNSCVRRCVVDYAGGNITTHDATHTQ